MQFQLPQKSIEVQRNFLIVDSQPIQISPLKVSGTEKNMDSLNATEQKQLLSDYSKYEMDYFTNELKIEITKASNQWVEVGSRNWFIWYFSVGKIPEQMEKKVQTQLFASTIIADKILTINAPIFEGGDFRKAGLIVDQMMKSLKAEVVK